MQRKALLFRICAFQNSKFRLQKCWAKNIVIAEYTVLAWYAIGEMSAKEIFTRYCLLAFWLRSKCSIFHRNEELTCHLRCMEIPPKGYGNIAM